MPRNIIKTEKPVILSGYQAVLKPSKFGYSMNVIVDQTIIDQLEEDRTNSLKWAESKLKNPKRSVLRPEPWEEVSEGQYKIKLGWNEEKKPPVIDTSGTQITDTATPIYEGSTVKVAFWQKPYVLKDNVTYGTSLKCLGIQVITLNSQAGVDTGDMDVSDISEMFGTSQGFKVGEPNISNEHTVTADDEDF